MPVYQAFIISQNRVLVTIVEIEAETATDAILKIDKQFLEVQAVSDKFSLDFGPYTSNKNHAIAEILDNGEKWRAQGRPIREKLE